MKAWHIDAWRSVVRTIGSTFKFGGRSRAMDVVYYWLVSMVAGFLISFPVGFLPWDSEWLARCTSEILLGLPFFALFARRMHDQGLSAGWTLALLPLPAINLYRSSRAVFAVRNPSWLTEPDPFSAWFPWLLALALVILVAFLRPRTRGPNRYGPDPRETASA